MAPRTRPRQLCAPRAVADVDVVLVVSVAVIETVAQRPGGADLGGPKGALQAVQPGDQAVGGGAVGADRLAVDLVDVDGAPQGVVGDPAGAAHVGGVAGVQAGDPQPPAAGQHRQQRLHAQVQAGVAQVGGGVAAAGAGGAQVGVVGQRAGEGVGGWGRGGGVAGGDAEDLVDVPAGVVVGVDGGVLGGAAGDGGAGVARGGGGGEAVGAPFACGGGDGVAGLVDVGGGVV